VVEGSPGQGNWATVPWISVFDPVMTTSATRGYYVVYLFHSHQPLVYLSLNQGTTAVREEFASKAREVLADRAEFMRKRVADYSTMLPASISGRALDCRGTTSLVTRSAPHTRSMPLPTEAALRTDLQKVVRAYRALTFRGGIEGDVEPQC
jgi:5-methylcytosine-specific restriction enzyme A